VCKHRYGDFTKDEKEYQDTICSEAEEGNCDRPWEVLYDYVVDPAGHIESEETSGAFSFTKKNSPFGFSGVDDHWETYPSALTDTILCLTTNFAALLALSSVNEAILVQAKDSNGTTVRTFSNFNLLRGRCTLLPFPFLPLSRHYVLLICASGKFPKGAVCTCNISCTMWEVLAKEEPDLGSWDLVTFQAASLSLCEIGWTWLIFLKPTLADSLSTNHHQSS